MVKNGVNIATSAHCREYMIIVYESDTEAVKRMVPEPLEPLGNVVLAEWIAMPDSTGFGDYQEAGIGGDSTLIGWGGEVFSRKGALIFHSVPPGD